jgi:hypothetical protein
MPSHWAERNMKVQDWPFSHIVVRLFEDGSSLDCVQIFLFMKNNVLNIL